MASGGCDPPPPRPSTSGKGKAIVIDSRSTRLQTKATRLMIRDITDGFVPLPSTSTPSMFILPPQSLAATPCPAAPTPPPLVAPMSSLQTTGVENHLSAPTPISGLQTVSVATGIDMIPTTGFQTDAHQGASSSVGETEMTANYRQTEVLYSPGYSSSPSEMGEEVEIMADGRLIIYPVGNR